MENSEIYIYRIMKNKQTGDAYIEEMSFSEDYITEEGPYSEIARFATEKEAKEYLKKNTSQDKK